MQDILEDSQYKVNVYAIIYESGDGIVESKELHEKVIMVNGSLCVYTEDMERTSALSDHWKKAK